jgi:hypothetical protein
LILNGKEAFERLRYSVTESALGLSYCDEGQPYLRVMPSRLGIETHLPPG